MNTINVKVNFQKGTTSTKGIALITGDYASTEIEFTFDREGGQKIFEMKSPSDEIVLIQEIQNNKILLTGYMEVTTTHNSKTYTKYTKDNEVYWYQKTDEKLFTDEWVEVVSFDLTDYTLVEEYASLFNESGTHIYEISLYENGTKLTSAKGTIPVKQEQIVLGDDVVEPYLPIFDELMQDVQEGLTDMGTAITAAGNLDISGSKSGKITTITITKKDGTTEVVQLEDGKSIEYNWSGTSLGIRQEGEAEYQYVNLKGEKGDPGAIKFLIVAELPETGADDTIYLVPITPDISGNNYAEYIYINGAWELLGKIGVQVDLTGYVKNTDYAAENSNGVIKTSTFYNFGLDSDGRPNTSTKTYSQYTGASDGMFIGKGTLENVITGKGLTTKSYVDGLVGDIATALDTINGEVI